RPDQIAARRQLGQAVVAARARLEAARDEQVADLEVEVVAEPLLPPPPYQVGPLDQLDVMAPSPVPPLNRLRDVVRRCLLRRHPHPLERDDLVSPSPQLERTGQPEDPAADDRDAHAQPEGPMITRRGSRASRSPASVVATCPARACAHKTTEASTTSDVPRAAQSARAARAVRKSSGTTSTRGWVRSRFKATCLGGSRYACAAAPAGTAK